MTQSLINIDGVLVDASLSPTSRKFRGAWDETDGAITVNMTKARNIHRDVLRKDRVPLLADLDVQWFRAVEEDDASKKSLIVNKKKMLRDVTVDPRIEAAQTPDELSALTLEFLISD